MMAQVADPNEIKLNETVDAWDEDDEDELPDTNESANAWEKDDGNLFEAGDMSMDPPQNLSNDQSMDRHSSFTEPKLSSLARAAAGHRMEFDSPPRPPKHRQIMESPSWADKARALATTQSTGGGQAP
jgi:hypothetical protein